MNQPLFGLALVPSRHDIVSLIEFRKVAGTHIQGPMLGAEIRLPHVSILQCPFNEADLTDVKLRKILDGLRRIRTDFSPKATLGDLYLQPVNWVFIETLFGTWIQDMQALALNELERSINLSASDLT